MTTEERYAAPQYEVDGGYLSCSSPKVTAQFVWDNLLSYEGRKHIFDLPNFDPVIFKQITGVDVGKHINGGNGV